MLHKIDLKLFPDPLRSEKVLDRLRREATKLNAEGNVLKKSRGILRQGIDLAFGIVTYHRGTRSVR